MAAVLVPSPENYDDPAKFIRASLVALREGAAVDEQAMELAAQLLAIDAMVAQGKGLGAAVVWPGYDVVTTFDLDENSGTLSISLKRGDGETFGFTIPMDGAV